MLALAAVRNLNYLEHGRDRPQVLQPRLLRGLPEVRSRHVAQEPWGATRVNAIQPTRIGIQGQRARESESESERARERDAHTESGPDGRGTER